VSADVVKTQSPGRRWAEAACDAIFWVTGLAGAAWGGGDLQGSAVQVLPLSGAVLAVCAMSVLSGLLSGIYRRRYRQGVLDDVASVSIAGGLMLMVLTPLRGALIGGQRTPAQTVAVGALFALSTMVAARAARRAAARGKARWRGRRTPVATVLRFRSNHT